MATKPAKVPRIATDALTCIEPPETGSAGVTTKDTGMIPGTRTPAEYVNWWLNNIYLWILYLDNLNDQNFSDSGTDPYGPWTKPHKFTGGTVAGSNPAGITVEPSTTDGAVAIRAFGGANLVGGQSGAAGVFTGGSGLGGFALYVYSAPSSANGAIYAQGASTSTSGGPALQAIGGDSSAAAYFEGGAVPSGGGSAGPGIQCSGGAGREGAVLNGGSGDSAGATCTGSGAGAGCVGIATTTAGGPGAVSGVNLGVDGPGVYGISEDSGAGVYGLSVNGTGGEFDGGAFAVRIGSGNAKLTGTAPAVTANPGADYVLHPGNILRARGAVAMANGGSLSLTPLRGTNFGTATVDSFDHQKLNIVFARPLPSANYDVDFRVEGIGQGADGWIVGSKTTTGFSCKFSLGQGVAWVVEDLSGSTIVILFWVW